MQIKNWDDLRYLLAVKRGRSLSAAAKLLGVNETTVSRRIGSLERYTGSPLIHRLPSGIIELTASGESVAELTENAEHHIESIEESLGLDSQGCTGIVRLTSVPIVVNQLFTPNVPYLLKEHPELKLELVSESRDLSLSRREADIAIRLARPIVGGTQVKMRKIGELSCSVYALRKQSPKQISKLPWITYDDSLAHIPPDQWIRKIASNGSESISNLRVHDAETALQAVLTGMGKTVLPDAVAMRERKLQSVSNAQPTVPPARELWMLTHTSQSHLRRILAVVGWIEDILGSKPKV